MPFIDDGDVDADMLSELSHDDSERMVAHISSDEDDGSETQELPDARSLAWPNPNDEVVSRIATRLSLADSQLQCLLDEMKLLRLDSPIPHNVRALRQAEKTALCASDFMVTRCPVEQPKGKFDEPMLEYDRYDLIHYDIMDTCQSLINIKEHTPFLQWRFTPEYTVDGTTPDSQGTSRLYSELWQCDWWREEQEKLPVDDGNILCIMLSSDETMITLTGRKMHPIYVFCGNYPRWFRARQSGWALLGFMPVIRACKGYASRESISKYRRAVKRWAEAELLRSMLQYHDGVRIDVPRTDGSVCDTVVFPRMPFFVGDEPEVMATVTSGMRGACHRPCTNCDLCPSNTVLDPTIPYLNPLMLKGAPRRMDSVTAHFDERSSTSTMPIAVSLDLSIHPEFNIMFHVPGLNPFMNPSCRMHQTDHGIFKKLIQTVADFFKKYGGRGAVNYFDHRWRKLNSFPKMKRFGRGVSSLKYVTATDHRWMSISLPFVLRNLDVELNTCEPSGLPRWFIERVAITYLAWRWLLGADGHTTASMRTLDQLGQDLQQLMAQLILVTYNKRIMEGPKYHKILHWTEWIVAFGCTGNYNAEVFECAHKFTVKRWTKKLRFAGSFPERRVMMQTSLYDYHVTDPPEDASVSHAPFALRLITKRKGHGGFRGEFNLGSEFALSKRQWEHLRVLENGPEFSTMALEHVVTAYHTIIELMAQPVDICAIARVLQTDNGFMTLIDATKGLITFFTAGVNRVSLFKKSWCSPSDAYVSYGSDVQYEILLRQRPVERFGRVCWMIAVAQRQFVIIQRFREVPYKGGPTGGETSAERMHRQSLMLQEVGDAGAPDSLKLHCRAFQVMPAYDVLHMERDGSETGKILTVVMTQPDFTTLRESPQGPTYSHVFVIEYVIQ